MTNERALALRDLTAPAGSGVSENFRLYSTRLIVSCICEVLGRRFGRFGRLVWKPARWVSRNHNSTYAIVCRMPNRVDADLIKPRQNLPEMINGATSNFFQKIFVCAECCRRTDETMVFANDC